MARTSSVILTEIQRILEQISRAVEFVFSFALVAGGLVLIAALGVAQDARVRHVALLRALGAARRQLLLAQQAEALLLGLAAGLAAALGASAMAWLIETRVLQLEYLPNWHILILGPGAGMLVVSLVSAWSLRGVLATPPMVALREA